jgi:epsilon-lactone hydrolase
MSWQNALACAILRRRMRPETAKPGIDVARARTYAAKRIWSPRVPKGFELQIRAHEQHAPLRGEWLRSSVSKRTILYLHGGGYYFCSPASHRAISFALAERAQADVFSLDYRLAPEHRFPAAVDDAVAAYRALRAQGIAANSIVIGGDSAGGGLALGALLALRDAGDALPAGAMLFSPWTDLTCGGASMQTNEGRDPMFHAAVFPGVAAQYLGDADTKHPYASPLFADLEGLPPLLIQVGDTELLLDDSTRLADRARIAGVDVDLQIWRNVPHIFQIWTPFMPEARRALADAARFAQTATTSKHTQRMTSMV